MNLPNPLPSRILDYLAARAQERAALADGEDALADGFGAAVLSILAPFTVEDYAILEVIDATEDAAREDALSAEDALDLWEVERAYALED